MSRIAAPAALLVAVAVGAVAAISIRGGASVAAPARAPSVSTARVVRGNLSSSVLTAGQLGYQQSGTLVNRLTGTLTWLPAVGDVVRQGGVLYRVDDTPVILMRGSTPAWRPFVLGMTAGPDVSGLQADLIALGDARGLLAHATGEFDLATLYAVERWQRAEDLLVTGEIPLGEVSFMSVPVRVGALHAAVGQAANPGASPIVVTGTRRIVTVMVNPTLPPVTPGERVGIVLASGQSTVGTVSSSGTGQMITVLPRDRAAFRSQLGGEVQVALTTQSVRAALTVPISALLALAGGGYGVDVVSPTGAHTLVAVHVGLFAGSLVQISGRGIAAGATVVVAQ